MAEQSAHVASHPLPAGQRLIVTVGVMMAVLLQVLDTTIANVALPHMAADLSASQDQINWVLTSYIVTSAIALPISGWLADRVGPSGRVVATDIDTRFMDGHERGNLEVRRHDLLRDPLESATFDLAHVRALLEHLGERERALRSLVTAVKPGGWVVVEDIDAADVNTSVIARYIDPPEAADLLERVVRAVATFVLKAGSDPTFGRRLPRTLKEAGLVNIGAELHAPLTTGGRPRSFFSLTFKQLRPRLVAAGLITEEDAERALEWDAKSELQYLTMMMVTAWGQRPELG